MSGRCARQLRRAIPVLVYVGCALVALSLPAPASAHANLVRAEPAIGSSVPAALSIVRLYFSEQPELRYSEIAVYSADHQRYDTDDLAVATGDSTALTVGVRALPQGIYTVVWKTTSAVDGHATSGSFAFGIGLAQLPQTIADKRTDLAATPTAGEIIARWSILVGASVAIGAPMLWALIWRPNPREAFNGDAALSGAARGRLMRLLIGSLVVLLVATAIAALVQVRKSTGRSLVGTLHPAVLRDFVASTRTGKLWFLRLVFPIGALAPLVLCRVIAPRFSEVDRARARAFALVGVSGFMLGELLLLALTSHAAASARWSVIAVAMDVTHLLAASVWIGGLTGLITIVSLIPVRTPLGRALLGGIVSRFSAVGLASVGILTLTGCYSAWLRVGSFDALLETVYGHALIVKCGLFGVLIALGTYHLLWVRPHLGAARSKGSDAAPHDVLPERFRRAIVLEVFIGAAVLLVAAVLTALVPAREETDRARAASRAQTMQASDLHITLTPSSLQPGTITYDVSVVKGNPIADAERVTLRFASRDLGIDETETVAVSRDDGHYAVSGAYTALIGVWQVRVIVRRSGRDDASATFDLPIGGAETAARRPASGPELSGTVLASGVGIVFLVTALLFCAIALSRYLEAHPAGRIARWSRVAVAAGLLLAYLVAGFGVYRGLAGQASSPLVADSWGPNEIHMGMAGQALVPDPLAQHVFIGGTKTIRAGTTLTFVNDDLHPHNIVSGYWDMSIAVVVVAHDDTDTAPHTHSVGAIPYPDGRFSSEILQPGQQWQFTFARPGTYPYFCSLHPGMQAIITVT